MSNTVGIIVNGERQALPEPATVQQLVVDLGLTGGRLAVEVNTEIVPRSEFSQCRLRDGDRVEIVHAIGGG